MTTLNGLYKEAEKIEVELRDLAGQQKILLYDHEEICKEIVKEERRIAEKTRCKN